MTPEPTVRPCEAGDYEAISSLHNAVYPDDRLSAAELSRFDSTYAPPCLFGRFVAVLAGEIVGTATFAQSIGHYHPRHFYLSVVVTPGLESRGLGSLLYDTLLRDIGPHAPEVLRTQVRETHAHALHFAGTRGYREEQREFVATLEPATFDETPFAGVTERVRQSSVVIRSLAELGGDAATRRNFYDLFSDVRQDVPRTAPATTIPFETFTRQVFESPDFLPAGSFVALEGETYVGLTQLWRGDATPDLFTGLTEVRRAYRSRGIALALKLARPAFRPCARRPARLHQQR